MTTPDPQADAAANAREADRLVAQHGVHKASLLCEEWALTNNRWELIGQLVRDRYQTKDADNG